MPERLRILADAISKLEAVIGAPVYVNVVQQQVTFRLNNRQPYDEHLFFVQIAADGKDSWDLWDHARNIAEFNSPAFSSISLADRKLSSLQNICHPVPTLHPSAIVIQLLYPRELAEKGILVSSSSVILRLLAAESRTAAPEITVATPAPAAAPASTSAPATTSRASTPATSARAAPSASQQTIATTAQTSQEDSVGLLPDGMSVLYGPHMRSLASELLSLDAASIAKTQRKSEIEASLNELTRLNNTTILPNSVHRIVDGILNLETRIGARVTLEMFAPTVTISEEGSESDTMTWHYIVIKASGRTSDALMDIARDIVELRGATTHTAETERLRSSGFTVTPIPDFPQHALLVEI